MLRTIMALAVFGSVLVALISPSPAVQAQCTLGTGAVVQLAGTPHLFVADEVGVLHWGGDTRALATRTVEWSNRCTVGLSELQATRRGDPWLSAGLPKIGDAIYLAKWEQDETSPSLLRIQSIADVELFGINGNNYLSYVQDQAAWQQRYGFDVAALGVGPLASTASFAWPEADRTSYGQLLLTIKSLETTALLQSRASGTPVAGVLPVLVECERQGLTEFELTRSTNRALSITQECLSRASVAVASATPIPVATAPTPAVPTQNSPTAPTGVRLTSLQGNGMRLDWNDVANNEDGYRVLRGGQAIATLSPNVVSFIDTAFNAGTPSCYTVVAFNRSGDAASLASCPGSPSASLPATPTRLHLILMFDGSGIRLDWVDNSNNEDGFRILRRGIPYTTVERNITTYTDLAPDPGLNNCYSVVAFNAVGQTSTPEACPGDPATGPTR